jgi:signal transduction histidine kinase
MYSIVKEYSENLPLVLGDEMLLEQVIRNLEINAAHAMGDQGTLTLNTRASEDKSFVEFSITDTGHGIPDDQRDQIFLPFYTTKEKGKGTGLGMYIVKQIVEQHKGYIQLKSDIGVGTSITIGLPVVKN